MFTLVIIAAVSEITNYAISGDRGRDRDRDEVGKNSRDNAPTHARFEAG